MKSRDGVEAMSEAPAVDVESGEDIDDRLRFKAPIKGPAENIEVFLARLEPVENAVEEKGVIDEAFLQQTKITAIQLDPKLLALEMFEPASPEVAPPVFLHPEANGGLPQVTTRLLTLDPFVAKGLLFALDV